jgi:hypothetical protein
VGPRAGLDRCGKSRPLPGFDPRTVQAVAQSLYRLSYPAHTITITQHNYIFIYIYTYTYGYEGKVHPRTGHEALRGRRGIALLFL